MTMRDFSTGPAWMVYGFLGIVILDISIMIILANTICKRTEEGNE